MLPVIITGLFKAGWHPVCSFFAAIVAALGGSSSSTSGSIGVTRNDSKILHTSEL